MLPTSGDGVQAGLHPSAYPLSNLFAVVNNALVSTVVR
jgi:hypothetical protein